MYMLHKLRGQGRSAHVFDAADGVGGTWYWNRYPGARCDVESMEYSYSFDDDLQQEWHWTERYAAQPEILAYANHVADRFDLRRDITSATRVEAATWKPEQRRWRVRVSGPDGTVTHDAQFVVAATGCLSSANHPDIAGLADFSGEVLHTGQWPHEPVDLGGKRVGVVGTGSSAIQAIPHIAEQSTHVTVFQRTPNYSIPARNGPLDPALEAEIKANYEAFRAANRLQPSGFGSRIKRNEGPVSAVSASDREDIYRAAWEIGGFGFLRTFNDLILSDDANATARRFVTDKIKETVTDPATAELLTPDQVIGCKRICVDTNYFETYNRTNVDLVDIKSNPIATVTESGIRLSDGQEFDIDTLVLATGFDAMTGSLLKIDFTGVDGAKLRDRWAAGPRTYLGLMAPGLSQSVHDHRAQGAPRY